MRLAWLALTILLAGCASAPPAPDPAAPDAAPTAATMEHTWPELSAATIRPGTGIQPSATYEALVGSGCTSNFLFVDARDGALLLGTAAHCFDDAQAVNAPVSSAGPCGAKGLPLGASVHIDGASLDGTLAYSSTLAMQQAGEDPASDVCQANDFALVALAAEDRGHAHPAVLGIGGPSALAPDGSLDGLAVATYGSTPYRPGPHEFDTAKGTLLTTRDGGWTHVADFAPLRIPGDSGSPVVGTDGSAVGIVENLDAGGHNGVADLRMVLAYARTKSGMDLQLATWPGAAAAP